MRFLGLFLPQTVCEARLFLRSSGLCNTDMTSVFEVPADDIAYTDKATIIEAVRAMHTGDAESKGFIRFIVGSHLAVVYKRIAAFLGDSVHGEQRGSSMVRPAVPDWVRFLNRALWKRLLFSGVRYYFIGINSDDETPYSVWRCGAPLNTGELVQQYWIMYAWHLVECHD